MNKAPQFTLDNQAGRKYMLKSFAGKWLILYFYPEDDTPGCTTEACSIRDAYQDIIDLGAEVVGVSKDTIKSHAAFAKKYKLNFILLSDPTGTTIEAYDAWGKNVYGNEGILRKTFIIDPNGTIRKIYGRVTPAGHGEQIVQGLKLMQSANPQ